MKTKIGYILVTFGIIMFFGLVVSFLKGFVQLIEINRQSPELIIFFGITAICGIGYLGDILQDLIRLLTKDIRKRRKINDRNKLSKL